MNIMCGGASVYIDCGLARQAAVLLRWFWRAYWPAGIHCIAHNGFSLAGIAATTLCLEYYMEIKTCNSGRLV